MDTFMIYASLLGLLSLVIDYFARKDKSLAAAVLGSFHNRPDGLSARKLSAFAGVMVSLWITQKYTSVETLEGVLMIWLGFSLLCLGIITFEQIIRFKGGAAAQEADKPATPQS
jgi:hypothetical protein